MATTSPFINDLMSGKLAADYSSSIAAKPPAPKTTAPSNAGVYWIGGDGKVYVKGSQGTNAAGTADANTAKYWGSRGFNQIADPSATKTLVAAPGSPNGGSSGGSSGPVYADKSNDLAIQNAGLAATDTQTQSAIAKINASLASILGGYDVEAAANKKNYTDQSNNNQNQFQTSKQTALVNAANGRQGLLGTLGSIGALSADGMRLANNAVQHGANEDLSGSSQTYGSNQTGLDTALGTFKTADDSRRKNANEAASDDIQGAQNSGASAKQNFLTAIANDYAAQGDSANAKRYSDMAAALYPTIASTSIPTKTLSAQTANYTPSTLANYVSKGNTIVQTSAPTTVGGLAVPGLTATTKKQSPAAVVV